MTNAEPSSSKRRYKLWIPLKAEILSKYCKNYQLINLDYDICYNFKKQTNHKLLTFLLNRLSFTFTAFFFITAGESIYSIYYPVQSVLPESKFSFILNFKQLSSFNKANFFLSLFLVSIKGESHYSLIKTLLLF